MTPEEAGRHFDEIVGLTPLKPKPKPEPEKPKQFPAKALSFGPGKPPQIPIGPVE